MTHEHALELMKIMRQMDYSNECILLTLINCAHGMSIGPALYDAIKQIRELDGE